jgi:hypothetical protein
VCNFTTEQVLDICLEEILKLEKELKEHYLLGKYGIIIEHNQISLSRTFLKYPVPIYRFMVIKFGRAQDKVNI